MSLIIGFAGQALFISHSGTLFDFDFDIAHLLKKASYICVLTGLMISLYIIIKNEEASSRQSSLSLGKLEDSEGRVRAIVENIVDGIITIDDKGTIQSVNKATLQIFRYSTEQLIGQNVKILAAEPHRTNHDRYLRDYSFTGKSSIIGVGREVEGRRQDGSVFPMHLEIAEISYNDERLFLGIVRDISKQKEVDRLKTEFVSTVSHELRTPLTSIRGALGMIRSGMLGDEDFRRMLELASNNTERLINLVNDLLDMEKLQADRMELIMAEVDLVDLVEKSVDTNAPYATEFSVKYRFSTSEEEAIVTGDSDRLTQVMANLLSNAAKFSPAGSVIEISVARQGPVARVTVADKGSGIPLEFHEKIFDRFSQGDSSDSRQKGGTGLGLSISRAIVEKHDGILDFESEPGNGSEFFFDLPLVGNPAPGEKTVTDDVAHEYEVPDMAETYTKSDRPRVLIVEDDGDLCEVIKTMAGSEMHFEIAGSVKLAEKRIARQTYDLIILDPGLPDGNSLDLLDQIRESGNSATPLVVYSSDELDHETAGKFDRYLQKAKNNSEDLLSVIRELI